MKKSRRNILIAFILNLSFTIIEIIGGLLTNSISILSDAVHDFGDSVAVGLSYFLEKKSEKKTNDSHTYGYVRYSVLSAFITSVILLFGGVFIIVSAMERLVSPQEVNGLGMIILAVFGFTINGVAAWKTSKSENLNEKSINLHMLEDVSGWAVVFIGSLLIYFFKIYIIDPILSILVAIYILYNVVRNLMKIFNVFLEKSPKFFDMVKYKNTLLQIVNVEDVHHAHIWTLDGQNLLGTLHVVIADDLSIEDENILKHEIRKKSKKFNLFHLTIQVERESEVCEEQDCCEHEKVNAEIGHNHLHGHGNAHHKHKHNHKHKHDEEHSHHDEHGSCDEHGSDYEHGADDEHNHDDKHDNHDDEK